LAHRFSVKTSLPLIFGHAVWRAIALSLLGIFLRSVDKKQTYWTFEDTLTQIGLGYVPLVVIAMLKPRIQIGILLILVVGYFSAFAVYPAPTPEYFAGDRIPGAPADWPYHPTGFGAHWDKNSNLAWRFDTWFLNLFPREKPFEYHSGGYCTLSFIPTLATMLLGLFAGQMLRSGATWVVIRQVMWIGALLLFAGYTADWLNLCPNVKRIWTPSWVMFSGGWCYMMLAFFLLTTDFIGQSDWSYPLRVIGANSIVAYVGSHLIERFLIATLKLHFGVKPFQFFGEAYYALKLAMKGA